VSNGVVAGDRRAGQDELTRQLPVVNSAANVVPDGRLKLPFIDETRDRTRQNERWIKGDGGPRRLIYIEKDLAGRGLTSGLRLPARTRPLHDDRAGRTQSRL
jgi:hypothetical protein